MTNKGLGGMLGLDIESLTPCDICGGFCEVKLTPDGRVVWQGGHNPHPYPISQRITKKRNGDPRCCDRCHAAHVLPARLKLAGVAGKESS
tara:strand:- start:506 stop:775 length:270 start_codon:yes stop_codon:yes gene_type:complete